MPFQPGPYAYSPDGKAIYATNFAEMGFNSDGTAKRRSLFRIELFPMHVIPVYGLEAIGIADLAISDHGDKIAVSGGMHGSCGIFELNPPNQDMKRVGRLACATSPVGIWFYLSLSPDGQKIVAQRNHHVDLIDLRSGSIAELGEGLILAAWSPDGKWIAAKDESDKTILMDAVTLKQQKILGPTDLEWSPDSRYLLASKGNVLCGYGRTLEIVGVATGARQEIKSSRCLVGGKTGWISGQLK